MIDKFVDKHQKIVAFFLVCTLVASAVYGVTAPKAKNFLFNKIIAKVFVLDPVSVTIGNNVGLCANCGDGVAQYTITTPSKATNVITCSDTGGCRLYILETSVSNGAIFTAVNTSSNTVTIPEASGVRELSSASALGQYDSMMMQYITDRWIQLDESNN